MDAFKFDAFLQSLSVPTQAGCFLGRVADQMEERAIPQDAARAVALRVKPSSTVSTASPLPSLSQGGSK